MNEAVFSDVGKWSKRNICFEVAILSKYKLGGFQLALLSYIVGYYDKEKLSYSKGETGVSLSYDEIAGKLNTNKDTARQSIKKLIEMQLILQLNKRKGRAKCKYMPNVTELKKCVSEYLKNNLEDKE